MPTIKGTASVSDDHAMAKQLKQTKFPKVFSRKVTLATVNIPVMSQWIEKKIAEILGFEDEIVASMAINLFLEPQDGMDPRRAQLNLVGFLGEKQSALFTESLWNLLVDAQDQVTGIPSVLLEEKKKEMQKQKEEEEQIRHEQPLQQQNHAPPKGAGTERIRDHKGVKDQGRLEYERRRLPVPPSYRPNADEYRGARVDPPPQPISPGRPRVDEFGRVSKPNEEERKPRAYNDDRAIRGRISRREQYEAGHRREDRPSRDSYREEHRGRRYRDDRRRFERDYRRYDDRDDSRSRRHSAERRRRRSMSSSSSSTSPRRYRSSSRSRSPS